MKTFRTSEESDEQAVGIDALNEAGCLAEEDEEELEKLEVGQEYNDGETTWVRVS